MSPDDIDTLLWNAVHDLRKEWGQKRVPAVGECHARLIQRVIEVCPDPNRHRRLQAVRDFLRAPATDELLQLKRAADLIETILEGDEDTDGDEGTTTND